MEKVVGVTILIILNVTRAMFMNFALLILQGVRFLSGT